MINWQMLASIKKKTNKHTKTLVLRIHRAYGVRVRVLREELENMLCRGGQALLVS